MHTSTDEMIVATYESPKFGRISVVLSDISSLFEKYEDNYASVFALTEEKLFKARRFKLSRGGYMVELITDSETLAIFTFGTINQTHLELGDVIKIRYKFLRNDYAEGLRLASQYFFDLGKIIVGYPNNRAIEMEMIAGYEIITKYVRNISFVILGLTFLMPVKVVSRKVSFNFEDWFRQDVIRFSRQYHGTAHRTFGLPVMTKMGFRKRSFQPAVGFLYEYIETRGVGDPFISYKGSKAGDTAFGLEYSDNSA